jgi:hypothetical protein
MALKRHANAKLPLAPTLAPLCGLLRSGMRGPVGDQQEGRLDVMAYRVAVSLYGGGRPVIVDARQ